MKPPEPSAAMPAPGTALDAPEFIAWVCTRHWTDAQALTLWARAGTLPELADDAPPSLAQTVALIAVARAGQQAVKTDSAWGMLQRARRQIRPQEQPQLYTRLMLELVRHARLNHVDALPDCQHETG